MAAIIRTSNKEEEKAAKERGLVSVSYDVALAECREICYNWKPTSEVFWLNYAILVPTAISAVPGALLTNMIRSWNNIPHKIGGRLLTVLPATLMAVACSGWAFEDAKADVLMNKTRCPVCLELRLTAQQLFFGVVTPAAISITGSHTYLATLSFRLPDPLTRQYWTWIGGMLRKGRLFLGGCVAAQVLSTAFLLYAVREEWANVNRKVYHELSENGPATQAARRGELNSIP